MTFGILLGIFLPLVGFLILLLTSEVIKRSLVSIIGCGTICISFISFTTLLIVYTSMDMSPIDLTLFKWIAVKGINADFALRLDPLSLLMAMIITGVGFWIHVYSIGYMDHDEDYARYFACMNFFIFSMLLLVLASQLLLMFVGWEGVGLASYLLIGYWYQKPEAAQAATKAFVVNRVGDFGFLLGVILTFYTFGTTDIVEISKRASQEFTLGAPVITAMTLLLFLGAIGKSAQIPLHVWLPDAMEGPTPVSALIHAATMVTAGVYLIVRMHPVFMMAPFTMQLIGVIGGVTALFAALCAVGQMDLKRVLAYSTVSQLGLMFLACGAGAFYSAMFHLTTHAFAKALLFLSAGNVVHMLHGTTLMDNMGGLSKKFKITHWMFLIGVLAMSGIPPLANFFSKDLILEEEYLTGFETLYYIALAASILTGFYLTRAYCLTFTGTPRSSDPLYSNAKEARPVMLVPVILLAILTLGGGFLGFTLGKTPVLESFLVEVGITHYERELSSHLIFSPEMLMAIGGSILGVVVAAIIYTRFLDKMRRPIKVLSKSFFVDEIYDNLLVKPLKKLSLAISTFVEPKVFDGSIYAATEGTTWSAGLLQRLQSGQIRSYAAWMVVGAVIIIFIFV